MTVERYDLVLDEGKVSVDRVVKGRFVKYEDYELLLKETDERIDDLRSDLSFTRARMNNMYEGED